MEYGVDYFNLPVTGHPGDWAAAREAEGWGALGVGDHITLQGQWALHAFPLLGAMVGRTSTVKLATAFANNLVRSPVEFTQFAVTMQHLSNGRFEAGIGAGWASEYIEGSGMAYPPPPERARRLREAVLVMRELFNGGRVFQGEFYNVDLPNGGASGDPPPIYAAVGGEWSVRNITPLVDRVEIFVGAAAVRGGSTDLRVLSTVTLDDVRRLIDLARSVNPRAAVGVGVLVGSGDNPGVGAVGKALHGSIWKDFFGPPDQVAAALRSLAEQVVDRVNVLPILPGTVEALTPHLIPM